MSCSCADCSVWVCCSCSGFRDDGLVVKGSVSFPVAGMSGLTLVCCLRELEGEVKVLRCPAWTMECGGLLLFSSWI